MTSPLNLQYGELRISSRPDGPDFDPDEITRRLGLSPSFIARRGEPRKPTGRINEVSTWVWETPERDERDSEVLVLDVLDALEPVATELAAIRAAYDTNLVVGLVIHMFEQPDSVGRWFPSPALGFDASTISRVAVLGCHLDVDLYVTPLDLEELDVDARASSETSETR